MFILTSCYLCRFEFGSWVVSEVARYSCYPMFCSHASICRASFCSKILIMQLSVMLRSLCNSSKFTWLIWFMLLSPFFFGKFCFHWWVLTLLFSFFKHHFFVRFSWGWPWCLIEFYFTIQIPIKGFTIKNSDVLSWAHCDSSKPGRSATRYMLIIYYILNNFLERNDQILRCVSIIDCFYYLAPSLHSERWVLHSTMEYANSVIAQTGLQKLSEATLKKVAEELFHEFQSTGLKISQPFFKKAHRWSVYRLEFKGWLLIVRSQTYNDTNKY